MNFIRDTIYILFVAYVALVAAQYEYRRVMGGRDAVLGEIPFIVSVRGGNTHGCGGSILNEKFVLTAAHCLYGWAHRIDEFSIQYGIIQTSELTPNVLPVKKWIIHENYVHSGGHPNDIAIIEVDGKIKFGFNAQPVKLPTPYQDPGVGVDVLLAGWGLDKSGGKFPRFLQKVTLKRISNSYCKKADREYDPHIHMCAGVYGGGKGQCTADSGGPLTIGGVQFGIVSWSRKPCGSPGKPGVFTKVTTQRNWIKRHTGV